MCINKGVTLFGNSSDNVVYAPGQIKSCYRVFIRPDVLVRVSAGHSFPVERCYLDWTWRVAPVWDIYVVSRKV